MKTEFDYDQVLKLPVPSEGDTEIDGTGPVVDLGAYEYKGGDLLSTLREETIGPKGMKIDRMLFEKFADTVRADETVAEAVEAGQWDRVIDYVNPRSLRQAGGVLYLGKAAQGSTLWTAA